MKQRNSKVKVYRDAGGGRLYLSHYEYGNGKVILPKAKKEE